MNIVWIEDFEGGQQSATIKQFFGSILDSNHFPMGWLGNSGLRENPELLEAQCRKHKSTHVVKLFSRFWDFHDWMDIEDGLDTADVILIDLNLDHGFTPDRPAQPPVAGKERLAGFFLFHRLTLVRGFPSHRIAFLTQNSDDVEKFNSILVENLFPAVTSFSKSGQGPKNLADWLLGFANNVATNLRRGIIGGLCEASSKHEPSALLERADTEELVRSVPALVRHEGIFDKHPDSIAYALAVPWEGVQRDKTSACTYARWMKSCRNALAHRHFEGAISKEELALIAFVALRAGWKFPENNLRHELLLFRACPFDKTSSRRQHHDIRVDLIHQIESDRRVQVSVDGGFSYLRKASVKKSDPYLDLVDFALLVGLKPNPSAFSLLAAGLWERLPKENRKSANESPTASTNHAATLAKMAMQFF